MSVRSRTTKASLSSTRPTTTSTRSSTRWTTCSKASADRRPDRPEGAAHVGRTRDPLVRLGPDPALRAEGGALRLDVTAARQFGICRDTLARDRDRLGAVRRVPDRDRQVAARLRLLRLARRLRHGLLVPEYA